ncbi:hypothetical protein ACFC1R_19965 [Kitasatospora sp. NPDC056138]|uniref:WXG100-like domain-containing protein n=1 Tax=Kitasatospora sp. NPDC056138 TaxID=3345724 RepID=UPI0035D66AD8
MAIELPGELVWVMDLLGLNWPEVNEDSVRGYAGHVRDFATNIDRTHQEASATIQQMGEHYQAASYEQLVERWARMSSDHMDELVQVCNAAAVALEIAADVIIGAKVAVITELGIMAAEFVAAQAAAVVTLGAAEAAEALLVEATKRVVNALLQKLEDEVIGILVEKAVTPVEEAMERALGGMVFRAAEGGLGAPSGGGGGDGFRIHPGELVRHAARLGDHAEEVAAHAGRFVSLSSGVSFG